MGIRVDEDYVNVHVLYYMKRITALHTSSSSAFRWNLPQPFGSSGLDALTLLLF